jgi:lipoate-protein ligase A
MKWLMHEWAGSARDFHELDLPIDTNVWHVTINQPAVVLGSSQQEKSIDTDALIKNDYDVVKRRTGGGAVLVDGTALWIDVTLPRSHRWWDDDVSKSMLWLGQAWAAVLSELSPSNTFEVHRGAMVRTSLSNDICFAGLAPGEVTVNGKKIVGISQRRSREGARFQCVMYSSWSTDWAHLLFDSSAGVTFSEQVNGCGLDELGISESLGDIARLFHIEIEQRDRV